MNDASKRKAVRKIKEKRRKKCRTTFGYSINFCRFRGDWFDLDRYDFAISIANFANPENKEKKKWNKMLCLNGVDTCNVLLTLNMLNDMGSCQPTAHSLYLFLSRFAIIWYYFLSNFQHKHLNRRITTLNRPSTYGTISVLNYFIAKIHI